MLIGRDRDLEALRQALATSALVTLTGPGGVGKTTLATAVASEWSVHRFADLAPLGPDGLDEAVAGGLGFAGVAELTAALVAEPGLLVLDNCEHVIDAAAGLAERLLLSCPGLGVLATSRERLAVDAELVVPLAPLAAHGPDAPAVELFRLLAARHGVAMSGDPETLVALTRRLDGLPLGIELAAARAGAFTPAEMLQQLDTRVDLLSRARRRGPARQHSLQAAIAWSYQMLDQDDRGLLDRLSLCGGPFTPAMAVALDGGPLAEALDRLAVLVDRSLVIHEPVGDVSWYRLLETINAFAVERLEATGDRVEAERRLIDHLVESSRVAVDEAEGLDTRLAQEMARTFRTRSRLIEKCRQSGRLDVCHRLIAPLWWLEDAGHHGEAAHLIDRVLGPSPIDAGDRALSAAVAATLHRASGAPDRAEELAEAVIAVDDGLAAAYAKRVLGLQARLRGDWAEADEYFRSGADNAATAGNRLMALEVAMHRALTMARAGDVQGARRLIDRLLAEAGPYPQVAVWMSTFLSWISLVDAPERSRRITTELEPTARERNDHWTLAWCLIDQAMLCLLEGDDRLVPEAAGLVVEAFDNMALVDHETDIRYLVAAVIATRAGRSDEAHGLRAAASALERHGHLGPFELELFERAGPLPTVDDTAQPLTSAEAVAVFEQIAGAAVAPSDPLASGEPTVDASVGQAANRFARSGDGWLVTWSGRETHVRDTKGMSDLRTLLGRPGVEVAALDLMGAPVVTGSAGPAADTEARRQYQGRVRDLQVEIEEAEANADPVRRERAEAELDRLVDELSAAYGLRGAEREQGTPAEKARSAVRWRIRAAIRRLAEVDPDLGAHLDRSVQTGRFCVYRPVEPTVWLAD